MNSIRDRLRNILPFSKKSSPNEKTITVIDTSRDPSPNEKTITVIDTSRDPSLKIYVQSVEIYKWKYKGSRYYEAICKIPLNSNQFTIDWHQQCLDFGLSSTDTNDKNDKGDKKIFIIFIIKKIFINIHWLPKGQ